MTRGATRGTWRHTRPGRRLRRELRRAASQAPRRNHRLARELHALHAAPARSGLGDARATSRGGPAARDVPARRARPRPRAEPRSRAKDGRRRVARGRARDRLRAARRRAGSHDANASDTGTCGARNGLQGSRRRDRAPQPRAPPARARLDPPGRPGRARVRVRRRRVRGSRGAGRAARHGTRSAAVVPGPTGRSTTLGPRGRRAEDPPGDPARSRGVRRAPPRATRHRDSRRYDTRVVRRPGGTARRRNESADSDARLDRGGPRKPSAARPRATARRAWARRRGRDAARRGGGRRVGARRLHRCAELEDSRQGRPADVPARAAPGTQAREEPDRGSKAVRVPHARPGRDARPLQGDRGASGQSTCGAFPAGS